MAEYKAPDIGTLSAHEYNKIRTSFDKYKATQGRYSDSPMYDPNYRVVELGLRWLKRKLPRQEESLKEEVTVSKMSIVTWFLKGLGLSLCR